jgi:flagellin
MQRLSSGQKINSGGDDAAGLIISEKMRDRIRSDEQAHRNVQSGTAMLKVVEGGIGNITEILKTMHEKSLQALNNLGGTDETQALTKELDALTSQIDYIASHTKYNGKSFLAGSNIIVDLQIGPEKGESLRVLGSESLLSKLALSTITDILSQVGSAGATLSQVSSTLLDGITDALTTALDYQGEVAKSQSRLGYQADNLTSEATNTQAAESVIRDTDMTAEMVTFSKYNVLSQLSQLMLAQAGQQASSVYNLLQS